MTHPEGRREENVTAIHPKLLTQITMINFVTMMEEMSANSQSSKGRHVWEPSMSAHFSVVKTGACRDRSLARGVVLPFVLEGEALTVQREHPGGWAGGVSIKD